MSSRALVRLTIPAKAEALKRLRDDMQRALSSLKLVPQVRANLVLALHEAAANVIRHAYPTAGEGRLRLKVWHERGFLRFMLRDDAAPVDSGKIKPRDLSECRPGGLGVNFIDDTMDSWRIRPSSKKKGNVLIMRKRLRCGHG